MKGIKQLEGRLGAVCGLSVTAMSHIQLQGLGTFDCKTELCTRHMLANSSIDRRARPQIAVERFAVLDFRRSLANLHLQSDAPRPCRHARQMVAAR
jgi:hypothetical protein